MLRKPISIINNKNLMFKTLGAALLIASAFSTKYVAPDCGVTGYPGGGHGGQGDDCTVIRLPDLPRTPDQVCVEEPIYKVPVIKTPTAWIPDAPKTPYIPKPGRPDVPTICIGEVPSVPTKPTLPAPCETTGGCWGQGGHGGYPGHGGCFPTKPVKPVKPVKPIRC